MDKKLEGKKCPKFSAECTSGLTLSNKDFEGKNLVIYFYPKDSTPGCTTEGQEFRDNYKSFKKLNTDILGISRDSIKSHENFKSKQSFPFELLSDPDEKVCNALDVMKLKSMYGREYMGVDRCTFLIDTTGKVIPMNKKAAGDAPAGGAGAKAGGSEIPAELQAQIDQLTPTEKKALAGMI